MNCLTFSSSNTRIKFDSSDLLENWIFNIYEQLVSSDPDWDIIRINFGDTEEDEAECQVLRQIYNEDPKEAIDLYREIMDEELEQAAKNFIFQKIAQEQTYNKEQVEQEIIGGEDLTQTEHGPIESPLRDNVEGVDPEIVDHAIELAIEFVPSLVDKAILAGWGDMLGVVEQELDRKIAKRKTLYILNTFSDQITQEQYESIMNTLKEEMSKSHAVRINTGNISNQLSQVLEQVKENVIAAGIEEKLNDIEQQAATIAVGSVIAHEGEHADSSSGDEVDPRGESSAEQTERNFITTMLQKTEFRYVAPFMGHDQFELPESEKEKIIEEIRIEIQKNQPQNNSNIVDMSSQNNYEEPLEKAASKKTWYKVEE